LRKKIEKMAHYLFNLVPPGSTIVETHHMRSLAGLLCWYSAALPLGRAFVYTLFQCRDSLTKGYVRIRPGAARDLTMWRALIRVALDDLSVLGCPIELLRSDRLPDFYAVTDACTRVGGGGWLAPTPQWVPQSTKHWIAIRWTPTEAAQIESRLKPLIRPTLWDIEDRDWEKIAESYNHYKVRGVNSLPDPTVPSQALTINILEFATVVFLIMVYAPMLRGCVFSIGSDNTATLCWLVRNRASCGAADNLLKLLALTCTIYNIRLVVHHVRGINNQSADWISRVNGIPDADPHEQFSNVDFTTASSVLTSLQTWLKATDRPDRRMVCRILLSLALTTPGTFSMDDLLRLLLLLRDLPEPHRSLEGRIATVLDAYHTMVLADARPRIIPNEIVSAVQISAEWLKSLPPS
jgi:hypothetical protein